jgi:hypothetical protein
VLGSDVVHDDLGRRLRGAVLPAGQHWMPNAPFRVDVL